jgi:hypothetical protein
MHTQFFNDISVQYGSILGHNPTMKDVSWKLPVDGPAGS